MLRNDDSVSRSVTGELVPNRLWKAARTKDEKLFDRKKKSENTDFVVDILLDSSGSQAKRQSQAAAQGYIISEALSEAGIPHRVSGYCDLPERIKGGRTYGSYYVCKLSGHKKPETDLGAGLSEMP